MKHTSDSCFVSLVGYRLLKLILKESSNAPLSESNTETLQGEGTLQWIYFVAESNCIISEARHRHQF